MSNRILAATRKGLFLVDRTSSSTGSWEVTGTAFLAEHVIMAMADPRDGSLYASLYHGHFGTKMHRSTDGGKSWTEIGVPVYPKQPEGEVQKDMWGRTIEWKLDRVWALEPGGKDEPGVLWCGTLPGGLFRSGDSGATWELVEALWYDPRRLEWMGGGADLPGIHSICVDPHDSRRVTIGVSCGGVWVTTDGGKTWDVHTKGIWSAYTPPDQMDNPNQDVHRVVQSPSDPTVLWAQHHNGIFRTSNRCQSWEDVSNLKSLSPTSFGFAVAVHPREPQTAWFVPGVKDEHRLPPEGKVVVARTRDGGQNYEILRNGLPQHHAYDLTYRHGLDIDESGDRLAFGSTTGSLWVTEDQGDSWKTVSQHLPPIYCVRFA
ncbi:MAG: exo-alpha-sialidase [Planctomycetes bacterium]|nr:exo-alpha-sialidase [Planctomycetota bacterium]